MAQISSSMMITNHSDIQSSLNNPSHNYSNYLNSFDALYNVINNNIIIGIRKNIVSIILLSSIINYYCKAFMGA